MKEKGEDETYCIFRVQVKMLGAKGVVSFLFLALKESPFRSLILCLTSVPDP